MKKRILLIALILIASYPFINCDGLYMDKFYDILLQNKTNHSINFYVKGGSINYPDTLLPEKKDIEIIERKVNGGYSYTSMREWKYVFKEFPKDTLSIFIFHTDTLNKYPWEKVRDEYKILKRYDLSLQDLENLDYKVPYPPSPEMAKMKMYPKYP